VVDRQSPGSRGDELLAGGIFDEPLAADAVSRAYLKMSEATGLEPTSRAPGGSLGRDWLRAGGSSQALLARGNERHGHRPGGRGSARAGPPNFSHIKKEGPTCGGANFAISVSCRDINLVPKYALDTVESIVMHSSVTSRQLLRSSCWLSWPRTFRSTGADRRLGLSAGACPAVVAQSPGDLRGGGHQGAGAIARRRGKRRS